jgi:hypothetical protein
LSARTLERARIRVHVAGNWHLRGHATHRVRAALVAGVDQQFRIRGEEGLRHRHLSAFGQHAVAVRTEGLEVGKDVVPAAAVEAGDARPQRVQDLVHLERGRQRLDQHGDLGLAMRQAERRFDVREHVFPQRRLLHAFHLRQVGVRAAVLRRERLRVVEEEQAEVEQ